MAFLRYTALRIVMLLVVGGIGYLIGLRGVLLAAVAFLVSGLLSFFVLDRQRDELGQSVGNVFQRLAARIESNSGKEDVD